jgi:hypothetical protein
MTDVVESALATQDPSPGRIHYSDKLDHTYAVPQLIQMCLNLVVHCTMLHFMEDLVGGTAGSPGSA